MAVIEYTARAARLIPVVQVEIFVTPVFIAFVIGDRMGVAGLGSILGLLYTAPGFGALVGTPTAGWLIDATGGYHWSIIWCFAAGSAAVALLTGLPVNKSGRLERASNARG